MFDFWCLGFRFCFAVLFGFRVCYYCFCQLVVFWIGLLIRVLGFVLCESLLLVFVGA